MSDERGLEYTMKLIEKLDKLDAVIDRANEDGVIDWKDSLLLPELVDAINELKGSYMERKELVAELKDIDGDEAVAIVKAMFAI